jgi:hypothetical protein
MKRARAKTRKSGSSAASAALAALARLLARQAADQWAEADHGADLCRKPFPMEERQ